MHAPESLPAPPYSDEYSNEALKILKSTSSRQDVSTQVGGAILAKATRKNKAQAGRGGAKRRARKRQVYTDAFKKKAQRLVEGGLTINQVAKSIGVSPPTLYRWVYSAEAAEQVRQRVDSPPPLISKERKKKVIRLIKYGRSPAQVAALLQIEETLIHQWLLESGGLVQAGVQAETNKRNRYDDTTKEAVLQQIHQGISIYRIAKTSGITSITIRKWKQQAQGPDTPLSRARESRTLTEELSQLERERDALTSALSVLLQAYY